MSASGTTGGTSYGPMVSDGAWHRAKLLCTTVNCTLDIDGMSTAFPATHGTAQGPIVIGPNASFDELSYYAPP
jgi:hypothetical protein